MIRFSAVLVAVAIAVLLGGIATGKLLLVYIAIVVSAAAMLALAIGVVLKREELFGGQGLVPADAGTSPALPKPPPAPQPEAAPAPAPEDATADAGPDAAPVIDAPTADAEDTDGDESPEATLVSVIHGVPRYHQPDCVLIRFMREGDVQQLPVPEAKAAGCIPCAACQPAQ